MPQSTTPSTEQVPTVNDTACWVTFTFTSNLLPVEVGRQTGRWDEARFHRQTNKLATQLGNLNGARDVWLSLQGGGFCYDSRFTTVEAVKQHILRVFGNAWDNHVFFPFRDQTSTGTDPGRILSFDAAPSAKPLTHSHR